MLAAVLLMSLLGAPQVPAPGPIPTHDQAAALAREGRFEAALDAYRRLAALNPDDHQARIWIARLHEWMGNPEQAEPVYRSVLLEDPTNFEAMLGTGTALVASGRVDEAIVMLERAETLQPQNADLLDALSRAYALEGRTTRALLYAERAWGIAPSDTNHRALEQVRLVHGHRVELNSFGERYNTATSDTGNVDLRINVRLREDLRLIARGQHQRKFGFSEQRGGGGLEWRWTPRTRLFGQVLAGPTGNDVLPRADVAGEVTHTAGPADWVAGYRFIDFPSAQVSVVSPGVTWWPHEAASLGVRYYASWTQLPTLRTAQPGHSVSLRAAVRAVPRVWTHLGYARGTEDFDTLSPDRAGDFRANTLSGGVRLDLRSLTAVAGVYEHQWRPDDIQMHRLTISLIQRF
jgi:YaiO family outer membrane protein